MKSFPNRLTFFLLCLFSTITWAAELGPHPSETTIGTYKKPEFKTIYIPIVSSSAVSKCDNQLRFEDTDIKSFQPSTTGLFAEATLEWCDIPVRVRVLDLIGTKEKPVVNVVYAETRNENDDKGNRQFFASITETCRRQFIYFEACYRLSRFQRATCVTSKIMKVYHTYIPKPKLQLRPPLRLELAPGDTARIVTKIMNAKKWKRNDPIGNGGFNWQYRFLTRSVIKSRNGRRLSVSPFKAQNNTVVHISKKDTIGRRQRFYNGSTTFIEFITHECSTPIESFEGRVQTKIVVSSNTKSLVKQDTKPPQFKQPKFSPIRNGGTTTVEVKATNRGGGMRSGGVPTEMQYQWYLLDSFSSASSFDQPDPYALRGETNPTLTLRDYFCEHPYGAFGNLVGVQKYYVDVCNTFGCKRSEVIQPRFIGKDGKIVSFYRCHTFDLLQK